MTSDQINGAKGETRGRIKDRKIKSGKWKE